MSILGEVTMEPVLSSIPPPPGADHEAFDTALLVLNKLLPPIIIVFGLIGNVLSYLVLRQKQYAKQTTCFYMRTLSIFDCFCLLGHASLRTFLNYHPGFMFGYSGEIICPILALVFGTYGLSNWTIALMTFDRFLAVRFPLKAASWCTIGRGKIAVVCLICVYLCIEIPYCLRSVNPDAIITKEICVFHPALFPSWFHSMYQLFHKFCIFTTPFFVVVIFNVSIVMTLIKERMRKAKDSFGISSTDKSKKQDGHITVLLFLVTLVFFITNIPNTFDRWIWDYILATQAMTSRLSRIRKVAYECVVLLLFVNPSINFYIYCLGCRKFREDVRAILGKKKN